MNEPPEIPCPTCAADERRTRPKRPSIGQPFAECPRCGRFQSRAPNDEWAMMSPGTRVSLVVNGGLPFLALGLLPAIGYGIYAIVTRRASETDLLLAVAVLGLLVSTLTFAFRLSRAVAASRRRMSDPMYQARLVKFGIAKERSK